MPPAQASTGITTAQRFALAYRAAAPASTYASRCAPSRRTAVRRRRPSAPIWSG